MSTFKVLVRVDGADGYRYHNQLKCPTTGDTLFASRENAQGAIDRTVVYYKYWTPGRASIFRSACRIVEAV